MIPNIFNSGTKAKSSEVNENFESVSNDITKERLSVKGDYEVLSGCISSFRHKIVNTNQVSGTNTSYGANSVLDKVFNNPIIISSVQLEQRITSSSYSSVAKIQFFYEDATNAETGELTTNYTSFILRNFTNPHPTKKVIKIIAWHRRDGSSGVSYIRNLMINMDEVYNLVDTTEYDNNTTTYITGSTHTYGTPTLVHSVNFEKMVNNTNRDCQARVKFYYDDATDTTTGIISHGNSTDYINNIVMNPNQHKLVTQIDVQFRVNSTIGGNTAYVKNLNVVELNDVNTVYVESGTYLINGLLYEFSGGEVVLSLPDITNSRYDYGYLDVNGDLLIETGTPSGSPVVPVLLSDVCPVFSIITTNAEYDISFDACFDSRNLRNVTDRFNDNSYVQRMGGSSFDWLTMKTLVLPPFSFKNKVIIEYNIDGMVDGTSLTTQSGTYNQSATRLFINGVSYEITQLTVSYFIASTYGYVTYQRRNIKHELVLDNTQFNVVDLQLGRWAASSSNSIRRSTILFNDKLEIKTEQIGE